MVIAGLVALVAALLAAWYGAAAARAARRLTDGTGATCATVVPSTGRVSLDGRAEAGPHGLLTAPLSGRPCVWYRSVVTEHWSELDRSLVRDFDRDGYLDRSEADAATRERRHTSTDASTQPFLLRDATGQVLVDPRGMTADRLTRSLRTSDRGQAQGYFPDNTVPIERAGFGVGRASGRGRSRFDREETLLAPGTPVSVTGQVVRHPDGTMAVGGAGLVVSSRGPAELRSEHLARARLARAAAVVAALAGVALLLAAAATGG
jgi:hypothetical protein